jgi:hypothetical protein
MHRDPRLPRLKPTGFKSYRPRRVSHVRHTRIDQRCVPHYRVWCHARNLVITLRCTVSAIAESGRCDVTRRLLRWTTARTGGGDVGNRPTPPSVSPSPPPSVSLCQGQLVPRKGCKGPMEATTVGSSAAHRHSLRRTKRSGWPTEAEVGNRSQQARDACIPSSVPMPTSMMRSDSPLHVVDAGELCMLGRDMLCRTYTAANTVQGPCELL